MSWSVLIVDDEPMTRDLLRLMLGTVGFRVWEAEDGLDALEKVKIQPPDVLLLDVMMPRMDGFTLCKKLRQDESTAHLPIIILSARAHMEAVREGLAAGATRYLPKPASRNDLIRNINEVLNDTMSV